MSKAERLIKIIENCPNLNRYIDQINESSNDKDVLDLVKTIQDDFPSSLNSLKSMTYRDLLLLQNIHNPNEPYNLNQ